MLRQTSFHLLLLQYNWTFIYAINNLLKLIKITFCLQQRSKLCSFLINIFKECQINTTHIWVGNMSELVTQFPVVWFDFGKYGWFFWSARSVFWCWSSFIFRSKAGVADESIVFFLIRESFQIVCLGWPYLFDLSDAVSFISFSSYAHIKQFFEILNWLNL